MPIARWVAGIVLALLLVPASAHAQQCSVSATPVGFGTYLPFSGTPTDSTGTVTVGCVLFGRYTISLNAGANSGGSVANRRMRSGSALLSYQLYTNASHTTVWGDGTAGSSVVSRFCAIACNNNYTVYGRIPSLQVVRPGTYIDTIVVTVTY